MWASFHNAHIFDRSSLAREGQADEFNLVTVRIHVSVHSAA